MSKTIKNKENKKVISIYRIDPELDILKENGKDAWKNIQKNVENSKYKSSELKLKENFLNKYDRICYKFEVNSPVGWKNFVEEFLQEELKLKTSYSNSILLLLKSKDNIDDIFAITFGNLAYYVIQKYLDPNFGLDILARMINPNSNAVKSSKGQNVTGSTQGQLSVYRQLHSLNDIEDFGKIFQELNANVKKEMLEKFGITTDKDFKNCCAKSSFQIRTSVKPEIIEKYIDGCLYVKKLPEQVINSSKKLDKRKDKELINIIIKDEIVELWNALKEGVLFDICHKDFDKFLEADVYKICYAKKCESFGIDNNLNDLVKIFNIADEEEFEKFIKRAKIESRDEEKNLLTQDTLFNHLFLEYTKENKKYFILNGVIYNLKDSYIKTLCEQIKTLKDRDYFIETLNPWLKNKVEEDFNYEYKNKEGFIVVHPYKYKQIELCDIIKYDDNELYLYFIKNEFKATIRDLSYQVFNTAKIIQNDINSNFKFLTEFYKVFKKAHSSRINLSEEDFINMFKTKRIRYVFAFKDDKNRLIQDYPEKFSSNIAKFALLDLVNKMNSITKGSLKIEQIKCLEN